MQSKVRLHILCPFPIIAKMSLAENSLVTDRGINERLDVSFQQNGLIDVIVIDLIRNHYQTHKTSSPETSSSEVFLQNYFELRDSGINPFEALYIETDNTLRKYVEKNGVSYLQAGFDFFSSGIRRSLGSQFEDTGDWGGENGNGDDNDDGGELSYDKLHDMVLKAGERFSGGEPEILEELGEKLEEIVRKNS